MASTSSLISPLVMRPLDPSDWQKNSLEWLVERCLFLITLNHCEPELFHGMDVRQGKDFYKEIQRINKSSFWPEMKTMMESYPDIYNELWFEKFFD